MNSLIYTPLLLKVLSIPPVDNPTKSCSIRCGDNTEWNNTSASILAPLVQMRESEELISVVDRRMVI